jgi:hypothetical protein
VDFVERTVAVSLGSFAVWGPPLSDTGCFAGLVTASLGLSSVTMPARQRLLPPAFERGEADRASHERMALRGRQCVCTLVCACVSVFACVCMYAQCLLLKSGLCLVSPKLSMGKGPGIWGHACQLGKLGSQILEVAPPCAIAQPHSPT